MSFKVKVYPAMLNIEGRLAVIIGGGAVACRKAMDLLEAGASVKVVSPYLAPELEKAASVQSSIEIIRREYTKGDLQGAWIVISATDDPLVNHEVFIEAEELKLFINAVDDPPNCSFIVPSVLRRGDLIAAVSTSGASPSIAAKIRRDIESIIPDDIESLLQAFKEARNVIKNDPVFSEFDFNMRGEILKKVSSDETLLEKLKESFKSENIREFLIECCGKAGYKTQ